jgi:hypothetical protein
MLIRMLPAPAAPAVEYNSVKFNITTKANRFVGAGPDVDRAWRAISYDSESLYLFLPLDCCIIPSQKFVVAFLTYLSGRPDDNAIRASHPRHARVLSESEASTIWSRGLPSWNGSLPSIALHQPAPKGDVQRLLRASWWRICSWT